MKVTPHKFHPSKRLLFICGATSGDLKSADRQQLHKQSRLTTAIFKLCFGIESIRYGKKSAL